MDRTGGTLPKRLTALLDDGFTIESVTSDDETIIVTLERDGSLRTARLDRAAARAFLHAPIEQDPMPA